jgi:gamma-glutamyltranspeptidase/glutathione hydrolase
MNRPRGVVAAGHPATVAAAETILHEGGNAFDAAVAAHFAACIAEPVLCSLAGGGFLLAYNSGEQPQLYDFFAQTPLHKHDTSELDFFPITADFGTAQQEFHIGLGAMATPGCVAGLFQIHRERCTLPMQRLVEPAIELARNGTPINDFQASIFNIIEPIYLATERASEIYADPHNPERIIGSGQHLRHNDQADFIETLAREGEALFYRGEIAATIDKLCREDGGHLTRADLEAYRVIRRAPLAIAYRDANIFINPPPSSGGLLIAFALDLLGQLNIAEHPFGSTTHLQLIAATMALTQQARIATHLDDSVHPDAGQLLNRDFLDQYRKQIRDRARSYRGTTHISIIDSDGNIASMTLSNGEGCGSVIPGTGVMLNNMLGEEDINPAGFHCWPTDQRMTSMMAPCVVLFDDGREIAVGSGGSNRIRSAILQVLSNLIDHGMSVDQAVAASRIHVEGEHLSIEGGFQHDNLVTLKNTFPSHTVWPAQNLFFGGAHTVMRSGDSFSGAGDPRRGGIAKLVL